MRSPGRQPTRHNRSKGGAGHGSWTRTDPSLNRRTDHCRAGRVGWPNSAGDYHRCEDSVRRPFRRSNNGGFLRPNRLGKPPIWRSRVVETSEIVKCRGRLGEGRSQTRRAFHRRCGGAWPAGDRRGDDGGRHEKSVAAAVPDASRAVPTALVPPNAARRRSARRGPSGRRWWPLRKVRRRGGPRRVTRRPNRPHSI